jgi:hypothetical protein
MSSTQLTHTDYNYIMALIVQLKDNRDLTGLTHVFAQNGSSGTSMKVSQKGQDGKVHTVVLLFQTLADGLAKKNGLEPGAVYITLRKKIGSRYQTPIRMVDQLCEVLIDDRASACLKALGNNEHVHASCVGPLVEELQVLMQKYTALPRKKSAHRPSAYTNSRRDASKLAASKLVVPKGGGVAGLLRKNEMERGATERTTRGAIEEKARRTIKEDKLEKIRDQVARNVMLQNFGKKIGATIRPTVGVYCKVHACKQFYLTIVYFLQSTHTPYFRTTHQSHILLPCHRE